MFRTAHGSIDSVDDLLRDDPDEVQLASAWLGLKALKGRIDPMIKDTEARFLEATEVGQRVLSVLHAQRPGAEMWDGESLLHKVLALSIESEELRNVTAANLQAAFSFTASKRWATKGLDKLNLVWQDDVTHKDPKSVVEEIV